MQFRKVHKPYCHLEEVDLSARWAVRPALAVAVGESLQPAGESIGQYLVWMGTYMRCTAYHALGQTQLL